ncbi:YitT family protein [Leyella stercorea]|uniref:YitT family protein n=1 Tax=Leyella stercorea TaxID=363265 RepID=UPI001F334300|nr:YitT family protein [Leyella stercorea]MCF2614816.1 YitT family protein [Leyella stercorea]
MGEVKTTALKQRTKSNMKDLFFIVLGILSYSVGYTAFILPEKVVMGGASGIAALVFYATEIPTWISLALINCTLLLIALKELNLQFIIRTVTGVGVLLFFVGILQPFFETYPIITAGEDKFMHVLIGGAMGGAGLGLVFSHNGSTGGTDIITVLLNKYFNMSFGRAMQFVDCTIICSSYLLFRSVETIVYGIAFTLVATIVCDYVINGARQTVQFLIISKKYQEIADAINTDVRRGVTLIEGKGWYSKNNVDVLIVLTRKYESQEVFAVIKAIDPDAVVSQTFCQGVFGEGFDKIK